MRDDLRNVVRNRIYGPRRDRAEVVFITIEGLSHIWAGGENRLPEFLVGKPTDKLKATDVIWNFFRKRSLLKIQIGAIVMPLPNINSGRY